MTIRLIKGADEATLKQTIYQQLLTAGLDDLAQRACDAFRQAIDPDRVVKALLDLSEDITVKWV
jgi:hypothetical protein